MSAGSHNALRPWRAKTCARAAEAQFGSRIGWLSRPRGTHFIADTMASPQEHRPTGAASVLQAQYSICLTSPCITGRSRSASIDRFLRDRLIWLACSECRFSVTAAVDQGRYGRGRAPGALSHMVAANLRTRALAPVVRDIWAAGFMSYHAMSRELNRRRVPTPSGRQAASSGIR